jgi:hypothetical protein
MRERSWFEEWRSTEEFAREVDSLTSQIPSDQYWGRGNTKWLREAWSLARYCELSKSTHLHLQNPDPPDAYVRSADQELPIEITFGLDPERRIGDEYKPQAPRLTHHDADEDRISTVRKVLEARIREKMTISYPRGTVLLIDLNMSDLASCHARTEAMLREILTQNCHPFSAVRLLWRNRLY